MARFISTNEPTKPSTETRSEAARITTDGADENTARLDQLEEQLPACGELEGHADDCILALRPLIKFQREVATRLDREVAANQDAIGDAKQAVRDGVSVFGAGHDEREREIRVKQSALDVLHVQRIKERISADPKIKAKAETLATDAVTTLRAFGVEIDKRRDAAITPPMNRSIQAIMNEESARQSWRGRPNMVQELAALYSRLLERDQQTEAIDLEQVMIPLLVEIRDLPGIKLAMRKSTRQASVTDQDRTDAVLLLAKIDRARVQRLPEYLTAAAWMHGSLREIFLLLAGYHGKFVSLAEFLARTEQQRDPFAVHPQWIWRGQMLATGKGWR